MNFLFFLGGFAILGWIRSDFAEQNAIRFVDFDFSFLTFCFFLGPGVDSSAGEAPKAFKATADATSDNVTGGEQEDFTSQLLEDGQKGQQKILSYMANNLKNCMMKNENNMNNSQTNNAERRR